MRVRLYNNNFQGKSIDCETIRFLYTLSLHTGVLKETRDMVNCGLIGIKLVTWIEVLSIPVLSQLSQISNTLLPHITLPILALI